MTQHVQGELPGRWHSLDLQFLQRGNKAGCRLLPIPAPGDDLRDHGVIGGRDCGAAEGRAVHAHPHASRGVEGGDGARSRGEVAAWILSVQSHFDRMAVGHDIVDAEGEWLASGYAQLLPHKVDTRRHFGDRVLDLDTSVHLEERKCPVRTQQELDGASTDIADGLRQGDGGLGHGGPCFRRDAWGRSFLDQFLVATLDGAVSVPNGDDVALAVCHQLHFDMPGIIQVAFQVDLRVGEETAGFPGCPSERVLNVRRRASDAEPSPTATAGRFHGHRVAVRISPGPCLFRRGDRPIGSGHHRYPGSGCQAPCLDLVTHRRNGVWWWPHEDQPCLGAGTGESGVLRKKPVSRVDGICTGLCRDAQDGFLVEVGYGSSRIESPGVVRQADVQGILFSIAVDSNGTQAKLACRPNDPDGDFAAIRNE